MTTEPIETLPVVPDEAPIPAALGAAIIEAENPADLVKKATEMATVLSDLINKQELFKQIGPKKHVLVEGWTTLGAMTSVFAHVEWSRAVEDGWEARVVVRNAAGVSLGAAEAQCTTKEKNWKGREDFAIRSMAQTRATSKALRMPLGWIMQLAGFNPTPAEEMDAAASQAARRPAATRQSNNSDNNDLGKLRNQAGKAYEDYVKDHNADAAFELVGQIAPDVGAIVNGNLQLAKLNESQCKALIDAAYTQEATA